MRNEYQYLQKTQEIKPIRKIEYEESERKEKSWHLIHGQGCSPPSEISDILFFVSEDIQPLRGDQEPGDAIL